jgi:hypothetical protein
MAVETASFISQLNASYPSGTDRVHQGDDHIRLLKAVLKATFPNISGPVTATQDQLNAQASLGVPTGAIVAWYGSDTAVPAGWAICAGQTLTKANGTGTITLPDLRGRVVMGASTTYLQGSTPGTKDRSLSTASAGGHTHTGSTSAAGGHNHGGTSGGTALSEDQLPAHKHYAFVGGQGSYGSGGVSGTAPAYGVTDNGNSGSAYIAGAVGGAATVGPTSATGSGNTHTHSINSVADHTHTMSINTGGDHSHSIATFDVLQPSMALHYIMKL